jgi:hypothetical protein
MADKKIMGEKNPIVALVIQICCGWVWIFGCLGYFYIGQWQKALVVILFGIISLPLSILTGGLFSIIGVIIWVTTVIDVFMQANELKKGHAIGHWTFFSGTA